MSSSSSSQTTHPADPPKSEGRPSLDTLVELHTDFLYRYAFRYFRSEDKAEELVQETFLAATQAIDRFQGNSSARTWLAGILRHKIMDHLRGKSREEPVDWTSTELDFTGHLFDEAEHWRTETGPLLWGASADLIVHQKQFLAAVERCLSKLPERVRHIFLLKEIEEQGREEIADRLSLSTSNVGVILHRARLQLQQCLQTTWFKSHPAGGAS